MQERKPRMNEILKRPVTGKRKRKGLGTSVEEEDFKENMHQNGEAVNLEIATNSDLGQLVAQLHQGRPYSEQQNHFELD